MTRYIVTGGIPLTGKIALSGAKNSGFKLMIAALLASSASRIGNIGFISEIDLAIDNITSLGGSVDDMGDHGFYVHPENLANNHISKENGEKSRSCTYYIPILLHKFGSAIVPLPGGDKIGARPLDRHFDGLIAMGAKIKVSNGVVKASVEGRLKGTIYCFEKNTHGGTDTLILAAVLAEGRTILENSALEPEIDNLINFLNEMGGKIKRNDRTIVVDGVERLNGTYIECTPDRNEAVALGCMALGTKGDVTIQKVKPNDLSAFIQKVQEVGGGVVVGKNTLRIYYQDELKATSVEVVPHPGFMTDWQAVWTALTTQAAGESVVHETVFDTRFAYVPLLLKMGAKIELFNPPVADPASFYNFNISDDRPTNMHAAKINGPTPLSGQEVGIKDIRAGATMIAAGLMAHGQTIINDPLDQIKRGYEDLPGKLKTLGAKIEVFEGNA